MREAGGKGRDMEEEEEEEEGRIRSQGCSLSSHTSLLGSSCHLLNRAIAISAIQTLPLPFHNSC